MGPLNFNKRTIFFLSTRLVMGISGLVTFFMGHYKILFLLILASLIVEFFLLILLRRFEDAPKKVFLKYFLSVRLGENLHDFTIGIIVLLIGFVPLYWSFAFILRSIVLGGYYYLRISGQNDQFPIGLKRLSLTLAELNLFMIFFALAFKDEYYFIYRGITEIALSKVFLPLGAILEILCLISVTKAINRL